MTCLNYFVLGAAFLGSSILTMMASKQSKNFINFKNLLNETQMEIYQKIIKERMSIYIQGLILGVLLAVLITFNSSLKSIPSTFVDNLMKRYDSSGKLLPIAKMKKGDKVKILEGPFANFIATIEDYETEQRIWILMDLMGRQTKIQTPLDALQP